MQSWVCYVTIRWIYSLNSTYAPADLNEGLTVPELAAPIHPPTTETELLLRMSSWVQPGLYEEEFNDLFRKVVKCACGMVMMQRVFNTHRCQLGLSRPLKRRRRSYSSNHSIVIDLTHHDNAS